METSLTIPSGNRTDVLSPLGKIATKQNNSQVANNEFIDNFLNTLVTSLNPNDFSLDKGSLEQLSQLLLKEAKVNPSFKNLDLKQFINNLKKELGNVKPHKLNLEALEEIVSNLINKFTLGKAPIIGNMQVQDKQSTNHFTNFLIAHRNEFEQVVIPEKKEKSNERAKIDDSVQNLLLNLRKFLTKDEFNSIKKSLLSSDRTVDKKLEPKLEAIQKFTHIMAGKETEAKNKIDLKTQDIHLELPTTTPQEQVQLSVSTNLTKEDEKKVKRTAITSENSPFKFEIDSQNGQTKIVFEKVGDNPLTGDSTKEQRKELLKQNIIKSDITGLLDKTNAQKVEVKKAENIMKSNFVENVIKNIKMTKNGGSNVARIMLSPRTLGDITLRISMVNNSVKLHIKADKSETAEHIDRQLPLLKDRLNDNGLKVEQVIIDTQETENLTYFNQQDQKNEQGELRRQFIDSFRNLAAKDEFEHSMNDVAHYNLDNPMVGYNKVGSITSV